MMIIEGAIHVPVGERVIRNCACGNSSINLTVILRGREVTAQYLIRHGFIKWLHVRPAGGARAGGGVTIRRDNV